jgi:hypothetical protein
LQSALSLYVGQAVQIDSELMIIVSGASGSTTYNVVRGSLASTVSSHGSGALVLALDTSAIILPFAQGFFENRASINYLNSVSIPDVRICAASLYVTNSFGNSQGGQTCYTGVTPDGGLRTLSGGQFSLQVSGYLATQQDAAPPLVVEATHAIRDMRATLGQAANGYDLTVSVLQDGALYQTLEVLSGNTTSTSVISGVNLPPLQVDATITLDLVVNPSATSPVQISPGKDLTVTIRF